MKKLLIAFASMLPFFAVGQNISTVAGTGPAAYSGDGGPATLAELHGPAGVSIDVHGNLYIADYYNNVIRKMDTAGIITTIEGTHTAGFAGDGGAATAATTNYARFVAFDHVGNIYIADMMNNRIRKINSAGIISTYAGTGAAGAAGDGGPATAAQLNYCKSMTFDGIGNMYIADFGNNKIRKITPAGIISTFAGTGAAGYTGDGGPASVAKFNGPTGIDISYDGSIYITDYYNNVVRRINPVGIISTFAGDGVSGYSGDGGQATAAHLNYPDGIFAQKAGNVFFAENGSNVVRNVNVTGIISTAAGNGIAGFSGDGGPATAAQLNWPQSLAVDAMGNYYIGDVSNNRVRKVTNANHSPYFTHGHLQNLNIPCGTTSPENIDTLLEAFDIDLGQTETWNIVSYPLHGTLVASYVMSSTGALMIPSGLTYTPTSGYSGLDSFVVGITDGMTSDITKVIVNTSSSTLIGPIIGADTLCLSEMIVLYSDSTSGGTWACTNVSASFASPGNLITLSDGIDTITYTATTACGTGVATKTITIISAPSVPTIIGASTVCIDSSVSLTDLLPGGVWSSSNSNATLDAFGVVTGLAPGNDYDTVTYTVSNMCGSTGATKVIQIYDVAQCDSSLSTALLNSNSERISIAPNPTFSEVVLKCQNINSSYSVSVFNEVGQLMIAENNEQSISERRYDLTTFPTGVYLFRVQFSNNVNYFKVEKE